MRNSGKVVAVLAVIIAMTLGQSLVQAAPLVGASHSRSESLYARVLSMYSAIWGGKDSAIWGGKDSAIWGGKDSAIWGGKDSAIWGGKDSAIWGGKDSAIWGGKDSAIWGGK